MRNATTGTLVTARGGTAQSGTLLGDLLVGTVTGWVKLTAGANGTVLTADSTTATGLKWV